MTPFLRYHGAAGVFVILLALGAKIPTTHAQEATKEPLYQQLGRAVVRLLGGEIGQSSETSP